MKLLKDISIGILIGALLTGGLVAWREYTEHSNGQAKAYTMTTTGIFTELLADMGVARLDYDDVMASATFKNLYAMLFFTVFDEPEDEALESLAQKYGMSTQDASALRSGAISPILDNPRYNISEMTHGEISAIAEQAQQDFQEEYELLSLKRELAISSSMSEIFSNGDVTDSGFDLVHDLDVIEDILFNTKSPTTLGGPIDWGNDSKPKEGDNPYPSNVEKQTPDYSEAYEYVVLAVTEDDEGGEGGDGTSDGEEVSLNESNPPEILEEDICPTEESELDKALDELDEEIEEYYESLPEEEDVEDPGTSGNSAGGEDADNSGTTDPLTPAKPGDWGEDIECNGLLFEGEAGGSEEGGEGYSARAMYYMCLESKTIWETYSAFVPVEDCIYCELIKMNAYLQETLSHSLLPGKVAGNFGETSKCKDSFQMPLVDINFIVSWAPAQTPTNDDAIWGKSIIQEFNKFLVRNHPYGIPGYPASFMPQYGLDLASELVYNRVTEDTTFDDIAYEIEELQDEIMREQISNEEQFEIASKGEDFVVYSQDIMTEVKQMTMYFSSMNKMFKHISEVTCPNLVGKDYLD